MKENTLTYSFQKSLQYADPAPSSDFFLWGNQDAPLKREIRGSLPAGQKVWIFPICWIPHPSKNWVYLSPDHRSNIGEKKVLIAFRQIFVKNSAEACIFSNTIMAYLKKLIGTKFQQDYLPELFPIVTLNIHGKPWRWGESHPTVKNVLIYSTRKILLMKFTLLSKLLFFPHEVAIFI